MPELIHFLNSDAFGGVVLALAYLIGCPAVLLMLTRSERRS